jgi:hypothetical protein
MAWLDKKHPTLCLTGELWLENKVSLMRHHQIKTKQGVLVFLCILFRHLFIAVDASWSRSNLRLNLYPTLIRPCPKHQLY